MSENTTESVESAGQTETENSDRPEAPEWAAKELERARKDAAKYRERARTAAEETETKLREEFTTREGELTKQLDELTEKYESSLMQVSESERSLTKLRLALDNGVPAENIDTFTKRLVGETSEELEEDAKSLAGFFSSSSSKVQEDHSQGSGAVALNSPTLLQVFERKLGSKF